MAETSPEPSDHQLLEGLKRKESTEECGTLLFKKYAGLVWWALYRIRARKGVESVFREADLEDLHSEVFIRLLERAATLDLTNVSLKTILVRWTNDLFQNEIDSRFTSKKPRKARIKEPIDKQTPLENVVVEDLRRSVEDYIRRFPEDDLDRRILESFFAKDTPSDETLASGAGVGIAVVRKRRERLREDLRTHLESEGYDRP